MEEMAGVTQSQPRRKLVREVAALLASGSSTFLDEIIQNLNLDSNDHAGPRTRSRAIVKMPEQANEQTAGNHPIEQKITTRRVSKKQRKEYSRPSGRKDMTDRQKDLIRYFLDEAKSNLDVCGVVGSELWIQSLANYTGRYGDGEVVTKADMEYWLSSDPAFSVDVQALKRRQEELEMRSSPVVVSEEPALGRCSPEITEGPISLIRLQEEMETDPEVVVIETEKSDVVDANPVKVAAGCSGSLMQIKANYSEQDGDEEVVEVKMDTGDWLSNGSKFSQDVQALESVQAEAQIRSSPVAMVTQSMEPDLSAQDVEAVAEEGIPPTVEERNRMLNIVHRHLSQAMYTLGAMMDMGFDKDMMDDLISFILGANYTLGQLHSQNNPLSDEESKNLQNSL